jgi:hypothetical protein
LICGWGDSNSQGLSHTHLKRARIPIPPHPLVEFLFEVRFTCFVTIPRLKGRVNRGGDGSWEMGDGSRWMFNPKSKIQNYPISHLPAPISNLLSLRQSFDFHPAEESICFPEQIGNFGGVGAICQTGRQIEIFDVGGFGTRKPVSAIFE